MPSYGRNPAKGLEPRSCAACGTRFQPYRDYQIACSRPCRDLTREQSPARQLRTLTCKGCGATFETKWSGMGRQPSCESCTKQLARGKMDRANAHRRGHPEYIARSLQQNFARYGMTEADFNRMLTAQGGVCILCGDPPRPGTGTATRRLHIDHDHATGKIRDLLCNNCNRGLGYLKDDPALLRAAADYIDRHRKE